MLLNSDELTGFVHLPTKPRSVSPRLSQSRQLVKSAMAPAIVRRQGLLLGRKHEMNAGETVESALVFPEQAGEEHCHIIGGQRHGKIHIAFQPHPTRTSKMAKAWPCLIPMAI